MTSEPYPAPGDTRDAPPPLALTGAQRGVWLGQQLAPGSARYNAAELLDLGSHVDADLLEAAIRRAVAETDALHVRVDAHQPVQRLEADRTSPVSRLQPGSRTAALEWMRQDLQRPFDLARPPLCRQALLRTSDGQLLWYQCAHHIALDGYGFALLTRRVAALYDAARRGFEPGPAPGPLALLVHEDQAYEQSAQHGLDRQFWLEELRDLGEPPSFAPHARRASDRSVRVRGSWSRGRRRALAQLARPHGASWVEATIAAFAAYLGEHSHAAEVVIGLPVMGRHGAAASRAPGMVMNIVPLRLALCEPTLGELAARVRARLSEVRPHGRLRYEQLRAGGGGAPFGPVINLIPFDQGHWFGDHFAPVHNLSAGPVEDLAVTLRAADPRADALLEIDGNAESYDDAQLAELRDGFDAFVETLLHANGRLPHAAARRGTDAADGLLWGPPLALAADDVVERLLQVAAARPAAIAIEAQGEHVRYAELVQRARRVAAGLQARGAGPGSRVAVQLPRSVDAVIAIWGVLMAGAAYLPLDPEGPPARNAAALADARPVCRIVEDAADGRSGGPPTTLAELEGAAGDAQPVRLEAPAGAYVIYTSGSTGRPNGVCVSRRALRHFVAAARQRYGLDDGVRVLQFAPLHFDASVEEIFGTLAAGGTLVLRDPSMLESLPHFAAACGARDIHVLDLPTAFWHELVFSLASGATRLPPCVHTVIIGGEAALPRRVQQWSEVVGERVRLLNTYGPTEATVVATAAELGGAPDGATAAPIGLPLPGVRAAVVTEQGQLARRGEPGELQLLGPTLADGYVDQPALQAQRFAPLTALPGAPLAYRTGDRVRQRRDGLLEYLGRLDGELKISGHRIDPGEVEAVLASAPGVREVAVVPSRDAELGPRLIAHLVVDGYLDTEGLRRHAAARLLAPAVPAAFVAHEQLPRNSSGKLDRKALEAEAVGAALPRHAEPTDLESRLLAIWREVLGRHTVGRNDDFFELGGQSLQALQLANRLTQALKRPVPASALFDHPTVARLAAFLDHDDETGRSDDDAVPKRDVELPASVRPGRSPDPHRDHEGVVVLTGASGFLGGQLLHALLGQTHATLVCLVRAPSQNAAERKLQSAVQDLDVASEPRVRVLAADVARPQLGLAPDTYARLARDCDHVFHCAASVSLLRDYASVRGSNVLGTRHLLELACEGRPSAFHHVSTLAAAIPAGDVVEVPEDFVAEPPRFRDGYARSKWAAERLVCQAGERGLGVNVFRLGRVTAPVTPGAFNAQDVFYRLLRAGVRAGMLPDLQLAEPWTPVDEVARVLVHLALGAPTEGARVFNLVPGTPVQLGRVWDWVGDYGYALERAPLSAWRARLSRSADLEDRATAALLDAQAAALESQPRSLHVARARLDAALCGSRLGFTPPGPELVHRYLDECVRTGFLPPPTATRGHEPRVHAPRSSP